MNNNRDEFVHYCKFEFNVQMPENPVAVAAIIADQPEILTELLVGYLNLDAEGNHSVGCSDAWVRDICLHLPVQALQDAGVVA